MIVTEQLWKLQYGKSAIHHKLSNYKLVRNEQTKQKKKKTHNL